MLTCCQCAQPPSVYAHRRMITYSDTHIKDPVVHVRVGGLRETRKDLACTLLTEG